MSLAQLFVYVPHSTFVTEDSGNSCCNAVAYIASEKGVSGLTQINTGGEPLCDALYWTSIANSLVYEYIILHVVFVSVFMHLIYMCAA
jgi:hypothetical protein